MTNRKSTQGFTLVELSIVLVVIGLIIGGVLTGKQIMQNAQITNAVNAIEGYQSQFHTYAQNYGALPGDDKNAVTRFSNAGIPVATEAQDGIIDGTFDSITENAESLLLWSNLRAAGLVKGAGNNTSQPTNPFGGIYGFQHGAFSQLNGTVICLNNVPGDAASAIDSRLDDGMPNSGKIMSMIFTNTIGEASSGTVETNYDSSNNYTMCSKV